MFIFFSNLFLFLMIITNVVLEPAISSQYKLISDSQFLIKEDLIKNKKNKIVTVYSKGVGKTLSDAKDDAAINAISKVVGTYIDSNQSIKKIFTINDSKKSFREISKKYFTFNKGNIYYFEVNKTKKINNIYYIDAIVEVSKELIEEYVDDYKLKESIIDSEINTISKSRKKYIKQRNDLLFNLFERKNLIDYQYIQHGKGQILENFSFFDYCVETIKDKKRIRYCDIFSKSFDINDYCFFECIHSDRKTVFIESEKYKTIKQFKTPYNILVLPFKISMRNDYIDIYKNLFVEISTKSLSLEYNKQSLIDISQKTNEFINKNKSRKKSIDRLIIFNKNNESTLTNYYIQTSPMNLDIYEKLFSKIYYEQPVIIMKIFDKFKNIKNSLFFYSSKEVNSSSGLCAKNIIDKINSEESCNKFYLKDAKIISVLNDLPISDTKEISLVNNIKNDNFQLKPMVVNTENNFLLFLNLNKFELEKDDSISLEFQ